VLLTGAAFALEAFFALGMVALGGQFNELSNKGHCLNLLPVPG
jgi:hypothetical protein